MELIINLVILLVIAASLVRGLRNVLEKGREISTGGGGTEAPGSPPLKPLTEDTAERQQPEVRGPVPGEAPSLEDLWRSLTTEEPHHPAPQPTFPREETVRNLETAAREMEADTVGAEDRFESNYQLTSVEQNDESRIPAVSIARPEPTGPTRQAMPALGLRFGGDDLVRGIVMSEILGPPVALRPDR